MRSWTLAIAFALGLLAGPAALAAPTCLNRGGDPVRCGTAGAMPVGWALPAGEIPQRMAAGDPSALSWWKGLGLFAVVGGILALFALMPAFEGDWDQGAEDD